VSELLTRVSVFAGLLYRLRIMLGIAAALLGGAWILTVFSDSTTSSVSLLWLLGCVWVLFLFAFAHAFARPIPAATGAGIGARVKRRLQILMVWVGLGAVGLMGAMLIWLTLRALSVL
jgi:hypothetical protein